ncbi:AlpA family transcriptional regulator [uncultured Aureimonas sp.]|uniref:helix-turn-helix transcriptional regulator n=1 Tax=uncultured Aureimonas sp. TaxID=1604662 RepID=UPI0025FC2276|nr:AlpA family phage regulatory protein [uncultured Aureimonas sp.]
MSATAPLLSADQVMSILNVSRTTLRRLEHDDKFPKPIRLGSRLKRWKAADIDAFIAVQGQ